MAASVALRNGIFADDDLDTDRRQYVMIGGKAGWRVHSIAVTAVSGHRL
jgi:hypothetical protein